MKRTLLFMALAICAATVVAGWSSSSSSSAGTTASASSGGSGATVTIGTTIAESGAIPLLSQVDGYKLAVADANAKGGVTIGGKKEQIKLVVLDNQSDLNMATQQFRQLVLQDKVVGVLGACCQQNIQEAAQADQLHVPFSMCCLPLELAPPSHGYSFIAFQTLVDGASDFFKLASSANTNKKMVIVTNNDPSGPADTKLMSGAGAKHGFTVVAKAAVPAGTTNFSSVISQAKAAGAQVLVVQMTPPDCFALWKQMKALGYAPKIAIGQQCSQTPGWAQLGALGNGTTTILGWTKTAGLPLTRHIMSALGRKWKDTTDLQGAASGYNAAQILIAAIDKAGSTDRAKVARALQQTNGTFALGHVVSNGKGQAHTATYLGQWSNGDVVQVYPAAGGSAKLTVPPPGLG
jgi:ABC-type branched-subunit amino acid transport system substrate-binding protein